MRLDEAVAQGNCTWKDIQKMLLMKTLQANRGNRTKTAKALGLSIRTIRNKIREFGLESYATPKDGHAAQGGAN